MPISGADSVLPESKLRSSFRDPAGFVFQFEGRVLRAIEPSWYEVVRSFLEMPVARELVSEGRLVRTRFLDGGQRAKVTAPGIADWVLAEHEAISFPTYPPEWIPEMLVAAGTLTLDLAERLLPHGWGLKDATPGNILFRGPAPVFVDLLSFEKREPGDALWSAYAQFVRTFLLPLLAHQYSLCSLDQMWLTHRDGLEPESVYRMLSWRRRLTPSALGLVSLPVWFSARARQDAGLYRRQSLEPERARFTLAAIFRTLRRQLRRLGSLRRGTSAWERYLETQAHYTAEQFAVKEDFVREALEEFRPRRVLDVGANTGHFSELATRAGASVVAVDSDEGALGQVWRRATEKGLDILPVKVDLCRPTPALGWRNQESTSFLDRAEGAFDTVLMLAVIHHMLITERVPLVEILKLAADLTTSGLVLEWVEPQDPMFRQLVRGRDELYSHLTSAHFESASTERFEIVRRQALPGAGRILYALRRKS